MVGQGSGRHVRTWGHSAQTPAAQPRDVQQTGGNAKHRPRGNAVTHALDSVT